MKFLSCALLSLGLLGGCGLNQVKQGPTNSVSEIQPSPPENGVIEQKKEEPCPEGERRFWITQCLGQVPGTKVPTVWTHSLCAKDEADAKCKAIAEAQTFPHDR
jgi:hypothetical protein